MEKKLKCSIFWIDLVWISYLLEEISSSRFKMYTVLHLRSNKLGNIPTICNSVEVVGGKTIHPRTICQRKIELKNVTYTNLT